jgi:hypothetical protein
MKAGVAAALLLAAAAAWAQSVQISYQLDKIGGKATNQLAVWIEDEAGRHVRTVFVTDFTARRRGFEYRAQALPAWVKSSGIAGWTQPQIDAVSGATQKPGRISLRWDCTDALGRRVPDGLYVVRVEGNLRWENTVLWAARIRVGPKPDSCMAEARTQPAGAEKMRPLLSDVQAVFKP